MIELWWLSKKERDHTDRGSHVLAPSYDIASRAGLQQPVVSFLDLMSPNYEMKGT